MIEAHDVRKHFGPVQALGGVGFTARDGHITALLGPNGAGKTTLLRTLVGMLKRDHGTIAVDGVDPEQDPYKVRANIGFLTDQFGLYERLSTREYLTYFGELNGMGGAGLRQRIDEVAEMLAMDDILERRSKGFSQGQRIKVARTMQQRARRARGSDPPARRGLLRGDGHPRDAGSQPFVRRRDRDRQGPHGGPGLAPATVPTHRHRQPGRRLRQPGRHR
jgi:sodium transport system ATP-binding protein